MYAYKLIIIYYLKEYLLIFYRYYMRFLVAIDLSG